MKYPWLFVGAKVVCVDASDTDVTGLQELTEGAAYTIRRVGPRGRTLQGGLFSYRDQILDPNGILVWLAEVLNREGRTIRTGMLVCADVGFRVERFRPLIDTTRTVEALRKLTLNLPERIDA